MKKRIFSIILALCLCISSQSVAYAQQEESSPQGDVITEETTDEPVTHDSTIPTPTEVYNAMIALQNDERYKEETTWTNDIPYSASNGYKWNGGRIDGVNISARGCAAFAFILSDAAFGSLQNRMYSKGEFTFEDIKVGDILRLNNDSHTVIVLQVSDAGVLIAEGNYNSTVHWGRTISAAEVMRDTSHYITRYPEGYVAPDDPEANKIIAEGKLGGLTWNLTNAGTLTISGNGAMPNYSSAKDQPWSENSSQIRTIVIEDGVTTIGNSAFHSCGVFSVKIPSSVTAIGDNAFYNSSIMYVTIPSSVKTIGDSAFFGCKNLILVDIDEGLETIGEKAFQACASLTSIALPASIGEVGTGAFWQCIEMTSATFVAGNKQVKIGDNIFTQCYKLMGVTLPINIDCIGAGMFQNCGMLAGVEIPQGAASIGGSAFASSGMQILIIPDSVKTIEIAAFSSCPLTDIYFTGTKSQWNSISKMGDTPTAVSKVNIHYEYTPGTDTYPIPTPTPTPDPVPDLIPDPDIYQTPSPTSDTNSDNNDNNGNSDSNDNNNDDNSPTTEPTSAPLKDYAVTIDTRATNNVTVSVTKDGKEFKSGDTVNINDSLEIIIKLNDHHVFADVPVVTADNALVGAAISKEGEYVFTLHMFTDTTNITVQCTTLERQFTITLPESVKSSIENADATLDFEDVTANSTATLMITPKPGFSIVSAKASISGNTCNVSEAEKVANGAYVITFSQFTANTEITSLVVRTEEVEVTESETPIEINIGEANLSETIFKDIQNEIKNDVKTAFDNVANTNITDDTDEETKKAVENAKKAIEAINNGTAFIEMSLTVDEKSEGITDEDEKRENDIMTESIKEEAQKNNNDATVEVKTAMILDISLLSICKNKDDKEEIARTSVSELTKPVKISMKLPDNIPEVKSGTTRTYYILCIHKNKDGKIESTIIQCDYVDGILSFDGSKFSTYVLCYTDVTPTSKKETGISGGGVAISYVTDSPAATPTVIPTEIPSATPSITPSVTPSAIPSLAPSITPSVEPSAVPSITPSIIPSVTPSETPSSEQTKEPSNTTVPSTVNSEDNIGKKVTVKSINYQITSVEGTKTVKITSVKKGIKKVIIPSAIMLNGNSYKVTTIAKNAFKANKKLLKVEIGANVNSIGKNAFSGCKNLKNIVIKTKKLTAKKVGKNAFKGINSNATVKVPKNKVKVYKKIIKARGAGKNVKVKK